ncbi:carboxylesterase family protein [Alteromonas sp. CI.11.F.A3]|uniref:carboxylesterase/lipase family protein n=1 Tax=Alteromonas sp. CI.11.F.A3 TaxID=3079555 RepID=UPI002942E640|nr:carboxylesterase family protein [Alteromonas sp. CI.11.F.A3]WOI36356.1 carboxylesterase family protein [Alteromonas sp. CI.11.F.A3]
MLYQNAKRVVILLCLIFSLLACDAKKTGVAIAEPLVVQTESGLVKGKLVGTKAQPITAFLGIPYAQAPVAELRWQPPQAVSTWQDTRDTTHFSNDCLQIPFPGDAAPLGEPVSEDCLYLNVWTPKIQGDTKLPVMVWIHGGGFVNGGGSPAVYNGQKFAESGVVFVSFNYRLGRFGFFAHPALSEENPDSPLGNYGFMDQIAALKWVKNNIKQFGGDENNVTLFGESAGGRSVNVMMLSPQAKGLFHKAIMQSGGGRSNSIGSVVYLDKPNKEGKPSAEQVGVTFAKSVGIESEGQSALAELRALPAEKVLSDLNMATMNSPTYSGPIIDGKVVVEDDETGFKAGHQVAIPIFIGSNDFEWGFLKDFNAIGAAMIAEKTLAEATNQETFLAAYQPFVPMKDEQLDRAFLGSMIFGDRSFLEPARFIARQTSANGQATWFYRFTYVPTSLEGKVDGAYHASEIPFVFGTGEARYADAFSEADKQLSEVMHEAWVNFAKAGNPSLEKTRFPQFKPNDEKLIEFNSHGVVIKNDPLAGRLDQISRLAQ